MISLVGREAEGGGLQAEQEATSTALVSGNQQSATWWREGQTKAPARRPWQAEGLPGFDSVGW